MTKRRTGAIHRLKTFINDGLRRLGYEVVRTGDPRQHAPSFDASRPLPAGAGDVLRPDHPRLRELQRRYAAVSSPCAQYSFWQPSYRAAEIVLTHFRGDNAYVWQFRNLRGDEARRYYLYATYIAQRDPRGLLRKLTEDGAFGAWVFRYESLPPISRDLLDSINEIYFLDRHLGLLARRDFRVIDVGAGYGRLADRMVAATDVARYVCVDGIPESTFLFEFYLGFRGRLGRAEVMAIDELDRLKQAPPLDLAINIHSFSEMPLLAIEGWVSLLAELQVRYLLIVPNQATHLQSYERNGSRLDFAPTLARHGFRLRVREPVVLDPDIRSLIGVTDHFFLFERV